MTHLPVIQKFDELPAAQKERATARYEQYKQGLKDIGYLDADLVSDPMARAAELATVAVALGGTWDQVLQAIDDQMLEHEKEHHATRGAAGSLALMWMGSSQDIP